MQCNKTETSSANYEIAKTKLSNWVKFELDTREASVGGRTSLYFFWSGPSLSLFLLGSDRSLRRDHLFSAFFFFEKFGNPVTNLPMKYVLSVVVLALTLYSYHNHTTQMHNKPSAPKIEICSCKFNLNR